MEWNAVRVAQLNASIRYPHIIGKRPIAFPEHFQEFFTKLELLLVFFTFIILVWQHEATCQKQHLRISVRLNSNEYLRKNHNQIIIRTSLHCIVK